MACAGPGVHCRARRAVQSPLLFSVGSATLARPPGSLQV